ncbi:transposase [Nitrosomonas supralitoralis]|uniref:Transposase InsH N-terminal domain-containing protein n=1 Tax=Nitrosomonas supralitoralis TaxID=2116706 RepID=A0A2P7NQT7_9PROT|nr:hypothetical protein C7H79_17045 [Nitrosomonas supralitoralis]
MSFSDFDVFYCTHKGNFKNQVDNLSDWKPIGKALANLYVMRLLNLSLEDVPDHSVLSRFRARLTAAKVRDNSLEQINQQISVLNISVTTCCHIDGSVSYIARSNRSLSCLMEW